MFWVVLVCPMLLVVGWVCPGMSVLEGILFPPGVEGG